MTIDWIINSFTTLFVIIDPLGLAPIFLVLTHGMNKLERASVALQSCLTAALILLGFAIAGGAFLHALGISLSAFRIAGGLLLFWTAFEMIFEKRQERKENAATKVISKNDIREIAIFPLAIPLLSGPGAISAVVLLSSSAETYNALVVLIGLIIFILLICYITFRLAEKLDRFLGESDRTILSRLLGVILAALSVQFVIDGILSIQ